MAERANRPTRARKGLGELTTGQSIWRGNRRHEFARGCAGVGAGWKRVADIYAQPKSPKFSHFHLQTLGAYCSIFLQSLVIFLY